METESGRRLVRVSMGEISIGRMENGVELVGEINEVLRERGKTKCI